MIKRGIGLFVGLVAGFVYYRIVGCSSGTCFITSSPWGSMFYGAVIGLLVAW